MKTLNRILFFVLLIEFSLLYIQSTHAFFSDSSLTVNNTFTTSNEFVSPTPSSSPSPTPTPEVLLNEVSPDGSSSIEWIELFNRSDHEIDVSNWKITDGLGIDNLPATTPIPAGGYGVIISSSSTVTVPVSAITVSLGSAIGDGGLLDTGEPIILRNASNLEIDSMSYGNNTTVFSSINAPSTGQSIIRDPNGTDTDTVLDWKLDTSPSIGSANSL